MFEAVAAQVRKIASDESLELTEATVFEEIPEWDSLNNVDLEMALETEFKIDFEVGEFEEVKDVASMLTLLETKVG
jgi:acyl carrier protein